jgi:hypothetical protein
MAKPKKSHGNWESRLQKALNDKGMSLVRNLMEWEVLKVRHEPCCSFICTLLPGRGAVMDCDCDCHAGEDDEPAKAVSAYTEGTSAVQNYRFSYGGNDISIRVRHVVEGREEAQ